MLLMALCVDKVVASGLNQHAEAVKLAFERELPRGRSRA